MARTYLIIVAAGAGSRFGSTLPKQFHLLGRPPRPVLMHTVDAFRVAGIPDADITVVLSPQMTDYWRELCGEHGFASPRIVEGGETRFHSVRNAIRTLDIAPGDRILVHDGARPLVSITLINRVINALTNHAAVVPAVPVTDSLRRVTADGTTAAVDRAPFRSVQTPQGFDAATLAAAYDTDFVSTFTDDASVVESAGTPIAIVDGEPTNIKITSPRDLAIATALMQ